MEMVGYIVISVFAAILVLLIARIVYLALTGRISMSGPVSDGIHYPDHIVMGDSLCDATDPNFTITSTAPADGFLKQYLKEIEEPDTVWTTTTTSYVPYSHVDMEHTATDEDHIPYEEEDDDNPTYEDFLESINAEIANMAELYTEELSFFSVNPGKYDDTEEKMEILDDRIKILESLIGSMKLHLDDVTTLRDDMRKQIKEYRSRKDKIANPTGGLILPGE